MRGYGKEDVIDGIRAAGGQIYAITSEPQTLARNAQEDWGTGIEHVGDPHQEILGACRDRGWLSLFTNEWSDDLVGGISWVSHPGGYFQPGVLALHRQGRVLYRWRCRPNRQNVGGAIARPTPGHVWTRVQAALGEPADAPDVPHDDDPELDARTVPWPFFVALLFANGWFLRPEPFDQRSQGQSVRSRQVHALLRMPLFLAAWITAFALLPWWIPSVALVAWVARVLPGIRSVNAQFQNVGPREEPA